MEWKGKSPVSNMFDDIYFDPEHGLQEVDYVFVEHNNLIERFQSCDHFTIGELGFGTGLNIVRSIQHFLEVSPSSSILHVVSCERYPLSLSDLEQALKQWPELWEVSQELLRAYPEMPFGCRRLWLFAGRVRITLLFGDAAASLAEYTGVADAWFFDGFAPQRNADMWSEKVFKQVALHSHAGTTFATFTAAGFVRRTMQSLGFDVKRPAGFGRKREMLAGFVRGSATRPVLRPNLRIGIVGAGIGGCSVAHVFGAYGCDITVIDCTGVHSGASGNSLGMVKQFLTRLPGVLEDWNAGAFAILNSVVENTPAVHGALAFRGIVHSAAHERTKEKAQLLTNHHTQLQARVSEHEGGVLEEAGMVVLPQELCRGLLNACEHTFLNERVVSVTGLEGKAMITTENASHEFDVVVVCAGHRSPDIIVIEKKTGVTRGQVAHVRTDDESNAALSFGHYALRFKNNSVVGATYDRNNLEPIVRNEDHSELLTKAEAVAPDILTQSEWEQAKENIDGRTSFRLATPQHLPLVGKLNPSNSVFVATAFGSRGLSGGMLAAETLAHLVFGVPSPIFNKTQSAVSPQNKTK